MVVVVYTAFKQSKIAPVLYHKSLLGNGGKLLQILNVNTRWETSTTVPSQSLFCQQTQLIYSTC